MTLTRPAAPHPDLVLGAEIADALADRRPVVALESTIIAHGMPYPDNLATAHALEEAVRRAGALPATIAIFDGRIHVGLDAQGLERLAGDPSVAKASRRDLPLLLATGRSGATTVAATMVAAHLAGIRVFATGGIGGVHRGAATSFDVSADLPELARTPVAVVCAGAKSILDLPKTLEYLETWSVPVIGYGTDTFPAFWARSSGLPVTLRADGPAAVAGILRAQDRLALGHGTVVANPIPETDALPAAEIDRAIATALEDATTRGIAGKETTPFLLSRIVELTGGRSLKANIALARHNAFTAGEIAVAYAGLEPVVP
ncbi:MAG: pseudouridine-5'-phosphate glycosidase [Azospirillaceae bacterium]